MILETPKGVGACGTDLDKVKLKRLRGLFVGDKRPLREGASAGKPSRDD